jgi:hypothetical protein
MATRIMRLKTKFNDYHRKGVCLTTPKNKYIYIYIERERERALSYDNNCPLVV